MDDILFVEHLNIIYGRHPNFAVYDFAYLFCNPITALLCSRVFWPRFVEVDGMVFHEAVATTKEAKENIIVYLNEGHSKSNVEQQFNRFIIPFQLFHDKDRLASTEEVNALSHLLVDMWSSRLRNQFPNRRFLVELLTPLQTGEEQPIISFHQIEDGISMVA